MKAKIIFSYTQEHEKSTFLQFSGKLAEEVLTVHEYKLHHIITLTPMAKEVSTVHECKLHHIITLTSTEL
jgi:hypothetical protein